MWARTAPGCSIASKLTQPSLSATKCQELTCYVTKSEQTTLSSTQDESWQPFWRRNSCYREWSKRQTPELICYEIRTRSDACVTRGWHSSAKGQMDNLTATRNELGPSPLGCCPGDPAAIRFCGLRIRAIHRLGARHLFGVGTYIHIPTPCALA